MKKGQIELEFRFGEYGGPIAFIIASVFSTLLCFILQKIHGPNFYMYKISEGMLYLMAFTLSTGTLLANKMREPSFVNWHLAFLSLGMTIVFYGTGDYILRNLGPLENIGIVPFYHRLFFALHVICMHFDVCLFGGKITGCFKKATQRYIILLVISTVLSVVLYLLALGGVFKRDSTQDNYMLLAIIPTYLQWVAISILLIGGPLKDIFGEMAGFMRMGPGGRGVIFLLLAVCPFTLISLVLFAGPAFLGVPAFKEPFISRAIFTAYNIGLYMFTPIYLMQCYTDNFLKDFPFQAADLSEGKRSTRKTASKTAKPSQKGKRMWSRIGVIYGGAIVGFFTYRFGLRGFSLVGSSGSDSWLYTFQTDFFFGDEGLAGLVASLIIGYGLFTKAYFLQREAGIEERLRQEKEKEEEDKRLKEKEERRIEREKERALEKEEDEEEEADRDRDEKRRKKKQAAAVPSPPPSGLAGGMMGGGGMGGMNMGMGMGMGMNPQMQMPQGLNGNAWGEQPKAQYLQPMTAFQG